MIHWTADELGKVPEVSYQRVMETEEGSYVCMSSDLI